MATGSWTADPDARAFLDEKLVAVALNNGQPISISSCKPDIMAWMSQDRAESGALTADEVSKRADQVTSKLGYLLRDLGALTVDGQRRIQFRKGPGGNRPYKTHDGSAFSMQLRPASGAAGAAGPVQPSPRLNAPIAHAQPSHPPQASFLHSELARSEQEARDELAHVKGQAEGDLNV